MATLESSVANVDQKIAEALLSGHPVPAEVIQSILKSVDDLVKEEEEEKSQLDEKQSTSTHSSETDNSHTSESQGESTPKEHTDVKDVKEDIYEEDDDDSSSTSSDSSTSSTSDKTYLKHSLTLSHRDGSTLTISAFTLNGTPCFEINGFSVSQQHFLEYLDELTNQDQDDETEDEIRVKEMLQLQDLIVKAILVLLLALFLALWLSIVNYGLK